MAPEVFVKWCARRDYSALRASPLRGRRSLRSRRSTWPAAKLSNSACCLSGVRIIASSFRSLKGFSGGDTMVRPERLLAGAPLVLRFAPARRHALRGDVQLGLRPSCRTRLVVCREFELSRRVLGALKGSLAGIRWCARRDCSRVPRSSCASLRPAATLCAATSNLACGQVVELGLLSVGSSNYRVEF